ATFSGGTSWPSTARGHRCGWPARHWTSPNARSPRRIRRRCCASFSRRSPRSRRSRASSGSARTANACSPTRVAGNSSSPTCGDIARCSSATAYARTARPRYGADHAVARMKASHRPRRSGRQKILVIEDDPVARTDLQARLKAQGYTVALVADAASALTVVNRERPDVILLDLGLPAGDGYLVLERLRKIKTLAAIPVLIITGRSDAETRKRVDAMGLAPVLVKPVDTEVLLAAIRSAVETKLD